MSQQTTASDSNTINLLFIDDEVNIINSLRMLFRRQKNTTIFTTTDQMEALEIVKDNQIHVIVSDMKMPNMLGSELLSRVRKISPNTMRILLSGYSDIADILDSINDAQVFRFIPKPWDNVNIKEKINDAASISSVFWKESLLAADTKSGDINKKDILYIGQADNPIYDEIQKNPNIILHQAKNAQYAMVKLFNHKDISVVILHAHSYTQHLANGQSHYRNLVALAKLLKSSRPTLISIIIARDDDSDNAITLINEAQIFRYLTEPLTNEILNKSINEATEYANILENTPLLTEKHRVEEMSEEIPERMFEEIPEEEQQTTSKKKGPSLFKKLFHLFSNKR